MSQVFDYFSGAYRGYLSCLLWASSAAIARSLFTAAILLFSLDVFSRTQAIFFDMTHYPFPKAADYSFLGEVGISNGLVEFSVYWPLFKVAPFSAAYETRYNKPSSWTGRPSLNVAHLKFDRVAFPAGRPALDILLPTATSLDAQVIHDLDGKPSRVVRGKLPLWPFVGAFGVAGLVIAVRIRTNRKRGHH